MTSLKLKILLFAFAAGLLPALVLGYLLHLHTRQVLDDKIAQELQGVAALTQREIDLRVGQRRQDVTAFSRPLLVQEALARPQPGAAPVQPQAAAPAAEGQLGVYLRSLQQRFPEYRRLAVVDAAGRVLAATAEGGAKTLELPGDWGGGEGGATLVRLAQTTDGQPLLQFLSPVRDAGRALLGAVVADLDLAVLGEVLEQDRADAPELLLVGGGRVLLSSRGPLTAWPGYRGATAKGPPGTPRAYLGYRGEAVLGSRLASLRAPLWVVAETPATHAEDELARLRGRSLPAVLGVFLVLALGARLFSLYLLRPLGRLIEGARQVANGDLSVALPGRRRDELGYLTQIFNRMVTRLRDAREALEAAHGQLLEQNRRLEALTVTDNLTGLFNRRHLTATLEQRLAGYRRNRRPVSVLMLDIDHFKRINDRYGHLAGDEVLRRCAALISASIRAVDYAARYGGEEFLVILFESREDAARESAERIRQRLEQEPFVLDGEVVAVTVSVGVAELDPGDQSPDDLIQRADAALYQAKRRGRNQVCGAGKPATIGEG